MSSSGITPINSGPLILRTYLNSSSNNTYAVGPFDDPVPENRVLVTSTGGLVVPSDTMSVSTLFISTLTGPPANDWSDYLFWNNSWQVGSTQIHLGSNAGQLNQGSESIAIGRLAAQNNQGSRSIAIGGLAGYDPLGGQSPSSIAIGYQAGARLGQGAVAVGYQAGDGQINSGSVSVGYQAGFVGQCANTVAIGFEAGRSTQSDYSIAIGYQAGEAAQHSTSIAIGYRAGFQGQPASTIIISALGSTINGSNTQACYIAPIRATSDTAPLVYNPTTFEVGYNGTKTFVIDHPTDSSKYLVHACLEGPEAGVYYRGQAEVPMGADSVAVSLPEYAKYISKVFTVQITPIFSGKKRSTFYEVSNVIDGSFVVYGEPGQFHWHVYGKRSDIVVEPLRSTVEVQGNGPYRWISSSH